MFDVVFFLSVLPPLAAGLVVTIKATVGGYLLALCIGLTIAAASMSSSKVINLLCKIYVTVMRCTPLLVQLYVAYYVLPRFGLRFDALLTGILVLGLYTGAYLSEVFRAGILAIPRGQWEAADSLGISTFVKWRKVILPQVVPLVIAPMGNYLIGMFKETPLLAAITVLDVFGTANDIAGQTYRYNEPYTAAALMLLAISLASVFALKQVEKLYTPVSR